jgi:hypothetical protein
MLKAGYSELCKPDSNPNLLTAMVETGGDNYSQQPSLHGGAEEPGLD